MHFTIQREALLKPLQLVAGVVERRQTLPVLSNVLLVVQGQQLSLTGTDLEVELVGRVQLEEPAEPGEITVPARKLMDICKSLPNDALIDIKVDTRTTKGNQEVFGGAFPAACLYAQPGFLTKNPNTAQALATAIVRADEWLQTASPADVAKTVPEGYLLGDQKIYEKSFAGVRETISPDGLMPAGAQENCLKFLIEADPKFAADKDKIKLADTWTNEFALKAKKQS